MYTYQNRNSTFLLGFNDSTVIMYRTTTTTTTTTKTFSIPDDLLVTEDLRSHVAESPLT